jgi:hypothetical protein
MKPAAIAPNGHRHQRHHVARSNVGISSFGGLIAGDCFAALAMTRVLCRWQL